MKSVWMTMAIKDRTILVLGFDDVSRESSLKSAKERAAEANAPSESVGVFNLMADTAMTRAKMRLWLAENDVIGSDATDCIKEVADNIAQMFSKSVGASL